MLTFSEDFRRLLGPVLAPKLDEADPLADIRELLGSYERHLRAMPQTAARTTHERDALLLRLLMSNPLPLDYFAELQFRANMTGGLYYDGNSWRIRHGVEASSLTRDALARGPYDVPIEQALSAAVENYLCDIRPRLFRAADLPAVFLPTDRCSTVGRSSLQAAIKNGHWNSFLMGQSLARTARQIWPDLRGFHAEQLRYLSVATLLSTSDLGLEHVRRVTHGHIPPGIHTAV